MRKRREEKEIIKERNVTAENERDLIVSSEQSIVPSIANLSLTPKVINFSLFSQYDREERWRIVVLAADVAQCHGCIG